METSYSFDVLINRANDYYSNKNYNDAISAYDEALKIASNSYEAIYKKGIILGHLGRNEEALDVFDQVLKIKPNHYEAIYNKGLVLRDLERYDEATRAYLEALFIKQSLNKVNRATVIANKNAIEDCVKMASDKQNQINDSANTMNQVYRGCFAKLPSVFSNSVKIFVSSTFKGKFS